MRSNAVIMLVSSLLCLILISIPMPAILQIFYPVWPIIFIFMVFTLGYGQYLWLWIWVLGLVLDSMQQQVLGTHVISLGLVLILMSNYFDGKDRFHLWQSMMMMAFANVIYLLAMMFIEGGAHDLMQYLSICGQTVASILLWPWLHTWLLKPKKKYRKMI